MLKVFETERYCKPAAHSFKRQVTHTVLPEIRKTGQNPWQVPLNNPQDGYC